MLQHLNPTDYVPIHGETYFLKRHADFIEEEFGFTTHLLGNFDQIQFDKSYNLTHSSVEETLPEIIHGKDIY